MEQDPLALLKSMGIDIAKMDENEESLLGKRKRNPRVCICGHPMSRHSNVGGFISCKPAKMHCHCNDPIPVLEASDTRVFFRKSWGSGMSHALTRGAHALAQQGKTSTWHIPNYKCFNQCGATENLIPVLLEQQGDRGFVVLKGLKREAVSEFMTHKIDQLLCPQCFEIAKGR